KTPTPPASTAETSAAKWNPAAPESAKTAQKQTESPSPHSPGAKEGNRAIAQAAVYCAIAPKSNAVYKAFNQAMVQAQETSDLPVPKHLCNAPTELMNELGYGENYRYAHDEENAVAKGQTYFPEALGEQQYYAPTDRGLEIKIAEKLRQLR
ncbi:MAG: hypothetical protein HAW58_05720, partial [Candidatus Thioglobus sp.]|nr:hypothetical protein [Candidatus Thioglobus sp.]